MKFLKYTIFIIFSLNINPSLAQNDDIKSEITKNLRCLICQGQSVHDSDSEFANSLKLLVDKKLNEGLNEKQIYNYLSEKYGEWILYDPEFNENTYFLWILPILMFLIGGAIILRVFIINNLNIIAPPIKNINIGNIQRK